MFVHYRTTSKAVHNLRSFALSSWSPFLIHHSEGDSNQAGIIPVDPSSGRLWSSNNLSSQVVHEAEHHHLIHILFVSPSTSPLSPQCKRVSLSLSGIVAVGLRAECLGPSPFPWPVFCSHQPHKSPVNIPASITCQFSFLRRVPIYPNSAVMVFFLFFFCPWREKCSMRCKVRWLWTNKTPTD